MNYYSLIFKILALYRVVVQCDGNFAAIEKDLSNIMSAYNR